MKIRCLFFNIQIVKPPPIVRTVSDRPYDILLSRLLELIRGSRFTLCGRQSAAPTVILAGS